MKKVTVKFSCDFCGASIPYYKIRNEHIGKVISIRDGTTGSNQVIDLCDSCYENLTAYCANHKKDKPA